ncbi:MAG: hypothetical protein R3277_10580 [Brumimicrobium sp.]|nr:hypothetical protein [Brumimicrobium sp.]
MPEFKPLVLPALFLIKFGYALFFLYIYTYYYGGGELTADAGKFFNESKILHSVFYESPAQYFKFLFGFNNDPIIIDSYLEATHHWNAGERFLLNDSRNVIRVNSVLLFLSNGEVLVHFLFFSLASFLGGIDLYQFVKKHSRLPEGFLLILLTLTPSIAFWGSSIIKEPLMILGLCLVIRATFDNLSFIGRTSRFLVGGILLFGFKPYVLFCLLPAIIFYLIFSKLFKKQWINILLFSAFGFFTLYFSGSLDKGIHIISKQQEDFINVRDGGLYLKADPDHYYYIYFENRNYFEIRGNQAVLLKPVGAYYMRIDNNFDRKSINLTNTGQVFEIGEDMEKANSGIEVTKIQNEPLNMLRMIPEVFFNTLVRPIPNEQTNWLQFLAFLENILILFGLIMAFIVKPRSTGYNENRILISLAIFSVALLCIVGWTTPVVGAIVRYVTPALIGIVLIIAIKIDSVQPLRTTFSFMKKN